MGQLSEHEGRYGQETHTSLDATDASSLDDLAKGLASGNLSRRKALRMLGAALVGGALASVPSVAFAAPCRSPRIKCAGQCCAEGVTTCQGTGRNRTCGSAPVVCPTGQEACGGQCVDTTTDLANCGGCGNACAGGTACQGGVCVSGVGGTCTSNNHCATGTTCQNGTCLVSLGGTCTGNAQCATGTCEGGVCACPAGQTACGGVCRDLLTDELNCGACGTACSAGQSCVNGICLGICPEGNGFCCSCYYGDPSNTSEVLATNCKSSNTCTGPYSGDFDCREFCQANIPEGMVQVGQSGGCFNQTTNPGEAVICAPFRGFESRGPVCQYTLCAPSGP